MQSLRSEPSHTEPVASLHAELLVFQYTGVPAAAGRASAAVTRQHGSIPCNGGSVPSLQRVLQFPIIIFFIRLILTVHCSFAAKIGAIRAISGNYLPSGAVA